MAVESISSSLVGAGRKIEELIEKAKLSSDADLGKSLNEKISVPFLLCCIEQFLNCELGRKLGPAIGVFAGLFHELDTGNFRHNSKLVLYQLLAKIKVFVGLVSVYDIVADSWDGLEQIVKNYFKHETVQDAFESLMTAEKNWNRFLDKLDLNLQNVKG